MSLQEKTHARRAIHHSFIPSPKAQPLLSTVQASDVRSWLPPQDYSSTSERQEKEPISSLSEDILTVRVDWVYFKVQCYLSSVLNIPEPFPKQPLPPDMSSVQTWPTCCHGGAHPPFEAPHLSWVFPAWAPVSLPYNSFSSCVACSYVCSHMCMHMRACVYGNE